MFGTFRKHSTALWVIIIAVIIVSFVIFFSPNVSFQSSAPEFSLTLDGKSYDRNDLNAAHRESRLAQIFGLMRPTQSVEDQNRSALQRLLLTSKVAQYGIQVGNEATAAWIRRNLLGPQGAFAGQTFEQLVARFEPEGFSADDLQRFARNQAGLQLLMQSIMSSAQLITPQEVEAAFRRENEKLEVEVAFLSHTNFAATITLDPAEVGGFYSNRMAAYRSPDRVQVHYVHLATSNYLADAEKSLAGKGDWQGLIDGTYTARGTNYYEGLSVEEAKGRIKQEMIDEEALRLARRKAYDFINSYWDVEPRGAAAVQAAATAAGLEMKTTRPFGREEYPEGLAVGPEFVDSSFKLTAEEPYSSAVVGADGFYALCFDQRIAGSVQPFAEVKEKVENEYRESRSRTLVQEAAEKLYAAATNSAASEQTFAALVEQAGFKYERLPALTPRMTTTIELALPVDARQIASLAFNQETNTVGRPNYAAPGMLILKTGERSQPGEDEVKAGLAEYRERMEEIRQTEIFNEWMQQQILLGGLQSYFSNPAQ